MRRTRLDQKLVAGIAGLFLLPGALAAAVLVALYRWGVFGDAFALLVTVVVGLAAMMGYLALIAHTIGHGLVSAIRHLELGTELIATVNPAHRIEISTGDELEGLAREINHLADRLAAARQDGARAAAGAAAELEAERARLAGVLEALGEGVLVLSPEGRVSLANGAARALLRAELLGRDLADIGVETAAVREAAQGFREGAHGARRLTLHTRSAGVLEAEAAPLRDDGGRLTALAIVIRGRASDRGDFPGGPGWPFRGAGFASGVAPEAGRGEPARFYDFALLDEVGRHAAPGDRGRRLDSLTATVLDIETTGLDPAGDRIVSIACVRIRNGLIRRGEALDVLVNPQRPIPLSSARIHGITDDMVERAPTVEAVLPEVLRFAENTVLVGHHVWFDLGFLHRVTEALGLAPLTSTHAVLDTRLLSEIVHGPVEQHDLDAVCLRLGVICPGRHSALGDALATAEVLVRLVHLLDRRGIRTVGEALEAMRRLGARIPTRSA